MPYNPDPIKQTFWKFLLPLEHDVRLLLLGGSEVIAESLRRQVGAVTRFAAHDPASNQPLPFGDGAFDIVVLIDAGRLWRLRRGRALRAFADETRRVAVANGTVAILAVNPNWPPRLSLSALRYACPRCVNTALVQAGLALQRWPLSPGNASPRYLFSLERRGLSRGYDMSWRGRLRRRLTETFLWNWLATEFLLIGTAVRRASFLDRLIADIDSKTGARGAYIYGIQTGNPATCLVRIRFKRGADAIIVRIPIDDHSLARCETNFSFFALAAARIPGQVPRPILHGRIDNQDYFAEEAITGITVDEPKFPLGEIAAAATALLIKLHSASREAAPTELAQFVTEVCAISHAKGLIDTAAQRVLVEYCRRHLSSAPVVLFHGDYKIENLILDRKSFDICALIDWDLARTAGPAMVDLLFLLAYRRTTASGESFERVYIDTVLADGWNTEERTQLQRYSAALKINPDHMLAYKALLWLHHFAFRISHVENTALFEAGLSALLARIDARAGAQAIS